MNDVTSEIKEQLQLVVDITTNDADDALALRGVEISVQALILQELHSIARSLEKIANPVIVMDGDGKIL